MRWKLFLPMSMPIVVTWSVALPVRLFLHDEQAADRRVRDGTGELLDGTGKVWPGSGISTSLLPHTRKCRVTARVRTRISSVWDISGQDPRRMGFPKGTECYSGTFTVNSMLE